MAIKVKIQGFEELLKEIEDAGGSINKACDSAIKQSAQIMQNELKSQMQSAGLDAGLISRMPQFQVTNSGNRYEAKVGYSKGSYNPDNLSDGYKAVFANYGTPKRKRHGKERARGYVLKAKKKANNKIKKAQEEAFKKILKRLQK